MGGKLLHTIAGLGGFAESADLEVQVTGVAEEPVGMHEKLAAESRFHHHPGVRTDVGRIGAGPGQGLQVADRNPGRRRAEGHRELERRL